MDLLGFMQQERLLSDQHLAKPVGRVLSRPSCQHPLRLASYQHLPQPAVSASICGHTAAPGRPCVHPRNRVLPWLSGRALSCKLDRSREASLDTHPPILQGSYSPAARPCLIHQLLTPACCMQCLKWQQHTQGT